MDVPDRFRTSPLNLIFSFYLAYRLALKAQGISDVNRSLIHLALRRRQRSPARRRRIK